jgi:pyruvate, water dikinase
MRLRHHEDVYTSYAARDPLVRKRSLTAVSMTEHAVSAQATGAYLTALRACAHGLTLPRCTGLLGTNREYRGDTMGNFVKAFSEITRDDLQVAGGKAANLGELTRARFNAPAGFCVTSESLPYHIECNQLQDRIREAVAGFDYEDFAAMEEKTEAIRSLIMSAPLPQDVRREVVDAIQDLVGAEDTFVAVRSSVAVKDSSISSFPGMMDTYHYLKGEEEIIEHIKMCWASLWTVRATFNRFHKGIAHELGLIAPIVQRMVNPEVAGILFTANPISGSRAEMVVEANWGLGESVVSGKSMNDFFLIDKSDLSLKTKKIAKKTVMVCFDDEKGFGRKEVEVPPQKMDTPTISDDQVHDLGAIGLKIEGLFGFPQDIEWAYQTNELFILQSRNVRNLKD